MIILSSCCKVEFKFLLKLLSFTSCYLSIESFSAVVHNLFRPRTASRLVKLVGGQASAMTKPMSDECMHAKTEVR